MFPESINQLTSQHAQLVHKNAGQGVVSIILSVRAWRVVSCFERGAGLEGASVSKMAELS